MDEDKNKGKPLFAAPYKDGDEEYAPEGLAMSDLLSAPPEPPPAAPQFQRNIVDVKKETDSAPIRTFQSDIAHAIKNQNTSVAQIALAEARKREKVESAEKENSASSWRNIALIGLSIFLFVAALGVIGYLLWPSGNTQQAVVTGERPIILTDSSETLPIDNLNRDGLIDALQKKIAGNQQSLGTVSRIIPVETAAAGGTQPVDAQKFMGLLAADIPDSLLRSFSPQFYLGVHVFKKNEPYLIMKVDSYQSAFAGMLDWEKRMPYDLADIFIAGSSRATTLNSKLDFRDEVVSNRDARALIDSASLQTVLIYSFPDKNTMIITTNERTLQEISDRLAKASLIRQ